MTPPPTRPAPSLVVLGASTGGCRILHDILGLIPVLPACVVIVQHMPAYITRSFVKTLSEKTEMPVKAAETGDLLKKGLVLVAPGDLHLEILDNREVRVLDGPKVNYVRPSIDVTMASVRPAAHGERLVGVILTGMGKDGAEGLTRMKQAGAATIAQEERSCPIFGMPDEAIKTGCVDYVLTPAEIAQALPRLLS